MERGRASGGNFTREGVARGVRQATLLEETLETGGVKEEEEEMATFTEN